VVRFGSTHFPTACAEDMLVLEYSSSLEEAYHDCDLSVNPQRLSMLSMSKFDFEVGGIFSIGVFSFGGQTRDPLVRLKFFYRACRFKPASAYHISISTE